MYIFLYLSNLFDYVYIIFKKSSVVVNLNVITSISHPFVQSIKTRTRIIFFCMHVVVIRFAGIRLFSLLAWIRLFSLLAWIRLFPLLAWIRLFPFLAWIRLISLIVWIRMCSRLVKFYKRVGTFHRHKTFNLSEILPLINVKIKSLNKAINRIKANAGHFLILYLNFHFPLKYRFPI